MLKIEEIKTGAKFKNIKTGNIYTVIGVGTHSENFETLVGYVNSEGDLWFRPLGLFRIKFEKL